MARALEDYGATLGAIDAGGTKLVPVPLHPSREKSRGYNQAFLLAWEVGERLGLEVDSRVLARIRNTQSQSTLDRERRALNVREAFGVVRPDLVRGKDVIVVDDLVTTGETAAACVTALEAAEPSSIAVLATGRVRD
jgi:predicted amidophosphoribosyltransferase